MYLYWNWTRFDPESFTMTTFFQVLRDFGKGKCTSTNIRGRSHRNNEWWCIVCLHTVSLRSAISAGCWLSMYKCDGYWICVCLNHLCIALCYHCDCMYIKTRTVSVKPSCRSEEKRLFFDWFCNLFTNVDRVKEFPQINFCLKMVIST